MMTLPCPRSPRALRAALVLGLVVVAGRAVADGPPGPALTEAQAKRVTPVVAVVQRNLGAIVNISTTRVVATRGGGGVFGVLFPDVFDGPRELKTNSVGSGSIIHEKGYVLTNAHVVARADELFVQLADGEKLAAHLVASLPDEDIAILKVDAKAPLPAISLGRSDDLMVGESVIAIGNPVGLGHSVTTGIISALDRELAPAEGVSFKHIIQTDAAINPGNSGGPLLNILGEQIGVNTAIRSDAQNVGFAIPVDRVKSLLAQMLGVEGRGRRTLGLGLGPEVAEQGVVVVRVDPESPAARAGLFPGAVVTAIGATRTLTLLDALIALLEQQPGKPFSVETLEANVAKTRTVKIEVVPIPDGRALGRARLGLTLAPLDAKTARALGAKPGTALVVEAVEPRTDAARSGVRAGDLVTRLGPYGVRTLDDVGLLLEHVEAGQRVVVRIVRVERMVASQGDIALTAR